MLCTVYYQTPSTSISLFDSCSAFSMYRQVTTGVIEFIVIGAFMLVQCMSILVPNDDNSQ